MSGQLEQPHNPYNREELKDVRILEMRGELLQTEIDIEAHRGYVVDDVDRSFDELALARTCDEPH